MIFQNMQEIFDVDIFFQLYLIIPVPKSLGCVQLVLRGQE
ncbi:hypothetical protein LEP1GSC196_3266 [Leptospira meyeri serovar Semaranga str. Veldrot Semarang 173]|nr:hypothetical protein LEP1GSC196_3266 [Leptospira meyeri serovar Semaranga str. Veldrot Semarang 173]